MLLANIGFAQGAENGCSLNGSNKVVLGQSCGSGLATLSSDREVPLNDHNITFSSGTANDGRIGIGTVCGNPIEAKLQVFRDVMNTEANPIALKVINNDIINNSGPNYGNPIDPNQLAMGIYSSSVNANNFINTGSYSSAYNGQFGSMGVAGEAYDLGTSPNTFGGWMHARSMAANDETFLNVGAYGEADNSYGSNMGIFGLALANDGLSGFTAGVNSVTIGGYFEAHDGQKYNYGVYATNGGGGYYDPSNLHVAGTNLAGFFDGDVVVDGSFYYSSDLKLKSNIKDMGGVLEKVRLLNPKTYDFKVGEYRNTMNLPVGRQYGVMAQDLQAVFPTLVKEVVAPSHKDPKTHKPIGEDTKFLSVNYMGLIPVLVQAVKELDAKTTENQELTKKYADMASKYDQLQSQLNDICSNGCAGLRGSGSSDAATPGNQLLQNVPNPFSQQTTIGYVINTGSTAYINVNALDGKLIKQMNITTKGSGSMIINGSELSAGTYTYSLYVDEKVIDTKIMVISATK